MKENEERKIGGKRQKQLTAIRLFDAADYCRSCTSTPSIWFLFHSISDAQRLPLNVAVFFFMASIREIDEQKNIIVNHHRCRLHVLIDIHLVRIFSRCVAVCVTK